MHATWEKLTLAIPKTPSPGGDALLNFREMPFALKSPSQHLQMTHEGCRALLYVAEALLRFAQALPPLL